jgi:hypothetical protein
MRRAIVAIAIASLLLVSICSAQQTATTSVPNLIRYSGTLKAAPGAALSSSAAVGVTFSIYRQEDGGAAVWMETQNVTPDSNGQYSVILGSTTAAGLPDDLFSQQEQRWLGVQVQGEAEQARVLLLSVPYAFKSREAETLGGLPASAFVKAPLPGAAGSVSMEGSAVNALNSAGDAGVTSGSAKPKAAGPQATCPGGIFPAADYIPIFLGPASTIYRSVIFQAGFGLLGAGVPFVGVGTATPAVKLDVVGDINAGDASTNTKYHYQILNQIVLSVDGIRNLFAGQFAGWPTGSYNTFAGWSAGYGNTGIKNTFVGIENGNASTGSLNAFFGYRAGFGNTKGGSDTCIGYQTCYTFDGANNTIVGSSSGFFNKGNNVTFLGFGAGYNNTADYNTFVGNESGAANTSGNSNTFLGNLAGTANKTGSGDTFVGDSAGAANVTNSYNTFMGQDAGKLNAADYNTFVGYGAGYSNTTGAPNTCIGAEACGSQTTKNTGQYNTATGFRAGFANTTGEWNTLYGTGAGINIQTGNANTMVGVFSGFNTTGNNNTFLGANAGNSNITGGNNIYLSTDYPGPSSGTESNTIRIGNWLNPNYTQQTQVFIDPILRNNTTFMSPNIPVLTIVTTPGSPTEGQLGYQLISTGGGNVMGSCTNPPRAEALT